MTRLIRLTVRGATICAAALLVGAVALELELRLHPYPKEKLALPAAESLRFRDCTGALLRESVNAQGQRAQWVPLEQVSPLMVDATLAVEDDRFFQHGGVDPRGLLRAAVADLKARRIAEGGSTITMQLVRRLAPHERTFSGKLGELLDALKLERALSKHDILEQYLNRAAYGADAIGVEAASRRYFGKPAAHLSLSEGAVLAGLTKAPSGLNPLHNLVAATERRRVVLERMRHTGRGSGDAIDAALREPLQLVAGEAPTAMHFTDWVRQANSRGFPPPSRSEASRPTLGLRLEGDVTTTLDLELQRELEAMVAEHVRSLSPHGVTNAALVVLDNDDCSVLAMIGSADYWQPGNGAVNGATARRQPGSTLKPFLYGLAFERGDSPASIVADIETRFGGSGGELYEPQNFSREFSGPVLMGEALGRSLNVPAVRVTQRVGIDTFLSRLHALGFDSLEQPASHYGLGLALGNGEVTLLELAQAYAALARGGRTCHARALVGAPDEPSTRAFAERDAWLVRDVLSDEVLRMRAFGPNNALMLGFPVAVKTGTSTNWRDNWAIGFTARYTVAVWAGDFDGHPLDRLAGAAGAGPLFHKAMTRVALRHGQARPVVAVRPDDVAEVTVCASSGLLATHLCPDQRTVRVSEAARPKGTCDHHRLLALDVRNGLLAGPKCPSRYVRLEPFEVLPHEYADWQESSGRRVPPTASSPLCPAEGIVPREVVVTWPRAHEVFLLEPGYPRETQTLELSAEVDPPAQRIAWWVDGKPAGTSTWPYKSHWPLAVGRHRLQAASGARMSDAVEFEVR